MQVRTRVRIEKGVLIKKIKKVSLAKQFVVDFGHAETSRDLHIPVKCARAPGSVRWTRKKILSKNLF